MIEVKECIVCGSNNHEHFINMMNDRFYKLSPHLINEKVRYVICTECGFVFQNPMPEASEVEMIYNDGEYFSRYDTDEKLFYRTGVQQKTWEHLYPWILENINLNGNRSLLDIGCGPGSALIYFRSKGWDVYGIEPTGTSEWGQKKFGLNIKKGFYGKDSYPGEKFQLIILSHVIEHFQNPTDFLNIIKENMADEGSLLIITPNIVLPKLPKGSLAGDHLILFSHRTLNMFLRKAGFDIVSTNWRYAYGALAIVKKENTDKNSLISATPFPKLTSISTFEKDDYLAVRKLHRIIMRNILNGNTKFAPNILKKNYKLIDRLCKSSLDITDIKIFKVRGNAVNAQITSNGMKFSIYKANTADQYSKKIAREICKNTDFGNRIIMIFGYGLGFLAKEILKSLSSEQKLIIYEDDLQIIKIAHIISDDLIELLNDQRVYLAVDNEMLCSYCRTAENETMSKNYLAIHDEMLNINLSNRYKKLKNSFVEDMKNIELEGVQK